MVFKKIYDKDLFSEAFSTFKNHVHAESQIFIDGTGNSR